MLKHKIKLSGNKKGRIESNITAQTFSRTDPSNRDLDSYLQTWQTFLEENRQFIEHFDFIRDLAVEDPGDSPVIMAKYVKTEVDQIISFT